MCRYRDKKYRCGDIPPPPVIDHTGCDAIPLHTALFDSADQGIREMMEENKIEEDVPGLCSECTGWAYGVTQENQGASLSNPYQLDPVTAERREINKLGPMSQWDVDWHMAGDDGVVEVEVEDDEYDEDEDEDEYEEQEEGSEEDAYQEESGETSGDDVQSEGGAQAGHKEKARSYE
ncbi:hypothetical protein EJ08DRAFT_697560 [Tothia fuscella]|uniref:Uncharacterized protein n=1 Tax=Tothia fuscella TaxID=1048955 RepID=A0A9P4NQM6_9PEZI|nr:hypothetical protein EJ08DRAFT_697560 [Tothia fuscella]